MEDKSVCEIVREAESNYTTGTTKTGKYVELSVYENNEKIDAYINSQFTGGKFDSLGREKPFFNIVIAARNIWYRATDIDRKQIKLKATKMKKYIETLLANVVLQDWMRRINFGSFLNEWGRVLATYGSAMTKFVEKDGMLYASVIPWNRLIVDSVDVDNDVKIEVLELTPAQLRKNKSYNQEIVKNLIESVSSRENLDGTKKDTKNHFIKVYEVHGELSLSVLKRSQGIEPQEGDEEKFTQQMHAVSFVAKKGEAGKFEDFTLYSGKEEKDPYMITHLIKEDGRATGIGAVEHLFEAQWMVNHTAKQIKDQLDLASKLIFQTADTSFQGRNVLTDIETGDIFIHTVGNPLTAINNKADITALQGYQSQWQALSNEITGISEAMRGEVKSGTAWRQTEALLQESHSLFELMTQNKGLHIEDMMREYVLPFVKKKLDTSEEVSAILDEIGVTQIDSIYIPNKATKIVNKKIIDSVLNDKEPISPMEQMAMTQEEIGGIKENLSKFGNQRFFKPSEISDKTWKEVFKELEWDVEVDVVNESMDTNTIVTTLTTVLQTLANPATQAVLQTPEGKLTFNKIMETVGVISPIQMSQLSAGKALTPQPVAQPAGQSAVNSNLNTNE
jgi:hypothetical protein